MDELKAPYGEKIEFRQIIHDTGIPLLRVIIREETKYHMIDLDVKTAHDWGQILLSWANTTHIKDN